MFDAFKGIDYWSVYPSSDGSRDVDLDNFATKMRESFKKRNVEEILIRNMPVAKRRFTKDVSFEETILSQLSSIIVNENIDLNGKCVCVIDDFSTNGTSCEATRHHLKKRGVRRIIFITMGKFGKYYRKLDFAVPTNTITTLEGEVNAYADVEFVKSLKDLM